MAVQAAPSPVTIAGQTGPDAGRLRTRQGPQRPAQGAGTRPSTTPARPARRQPAQRGGSRRGAVAAGAARWQPAQRGGSRHSAMAAGTATWPRPSQPRPRPPQPHTSDGAGTGSRAKPGNSGCDSCCPRQASKPTTLIPAELINNHARTRSRHLVLCTVLILRTCHDDARAHGLTRPGLGGLALAA